MINCDMYKQYTKIKLYSFEYHLPLFNCSCKFNQSW